MRPGRLISTNDPSSRYPLEGADHAWIIAMTDSHLEDEKTPRRFDNLHFTLELAETIDSKLVTANEFEKADLAKIVLSNSKIDAVSLYPTYRKPFDIIVRRAKNEEWLRGLDLFTGPHSAFAS